jgi:hypothetical protein
MDHFTHLNGILHAEDIPLTRIAEEVGTPVYVYSRATLERHAQVFKSAIAGLGRTHVAFAIKANPNLAVLRVLALAPMSCPAVRWLALWRQEFRPRTSSFPASAKRPLKCSAHWMPVSVNSTLNWKKRAKFWRHLRPPLGRGQPRHSA